MVARSREGRTRAFPVVETIHRNSILLVTEAPAHVPEDTRQRARQVAESAVACLDGKQLLLRKPTPATPATPAEETMTLWRFRPRGKCSFRALCVALVRSAVNCLGQ